MKGRLVLKFVFALQIFFPNLFAKEYYFDPVVVKKILKSNRGKVPGHYSCILMHLEKEFLGTNLEHPNSSGLEQFVFSNLLESFDIKKTKANQSAIKELVLAISSDPQEHTGENCQYCLSAKNVLSDCKEQVLIYLQLCSLESSWFTRSQACLMAAGIACLSIMWLCCKQRAVIAKPLPQAPASEVPNGVSSPIINPTPRRAVPVSPRIPSPGKPSGVGFVPLSFGKPVAPPILSTTTSSAGHDDTARLSALEAQMAQVAHTISSLEGGHEGSAADIGAQSRGIEEQVRKLREEIISSGAALREGLARRLTEVDAGRAESTDRLFQGLEGRVNDQVAKIRGEVRRIVEWSETVDRALSDHEGSSAHFAQEVDTLATQIAAIERELTEVHRKVVGCEATDEYFKRAQARLEGNQESLLRALGTRPPPGGGGAGPAEADRGRSIERPVLPGLPPAQFVSSPSPHGQPRANSPRAGPVRPPPPVSQGPAPQAPRSGPGTPAGPHIRGSWPPAQAAPPAFPPTTIGPR